MGRCGRTENGYKASLLTWDFRMSELFFGQGREEGRGVACRL